jgi:hypothetical protein
MRHTPLEVHRFVRRHGTVRAPTDQLQQVCDVTTLLMMLSEPEHGWYHVNIASADACAPRGLPLELSSRPRTVNAT